MLSRLVSCLLLLCCAWCAAAAPAPLVRSRLDLCGVWNKDWDGIRWVATFEQDGTYCAKQGSRREYRGIWSVKGRVLRVVERGSWSDSDQEIDWQVCLDENLRGEVVFLRRGSSSGLILQLFRKE